MKTVCIEQDAYVALIQQLDILKAENSRMRSALQEIADQDDDGSGGYYTDLARNALIAAESLHPKDLAVAPNLEQEFYREMVQEIDRQILKAFQIPADFLKPKSGK